MTLAVSDIDQGQFPSARPSSSYVQHKKQCTLSPFLPKSGVTEAEILRGIQVVLTHSSLRSCDGLSKWFSRMLSENMIAKSFTLGKTKCIYFINFSIVPYSKELLVSNFTSSDFFVTCYHESPKRVFQE